MIELRRETVEPAGKVGTTAQPRLRVTLSRNGGRVQSLPRNVSSKNGSYQSYENDYAYLPLARGCVGIAMV